MLARIRKSIKEKDAGFTLVELLVVMIIIGILAAIAIPVFLNQRQRSVDASIKSDLRSVAQEVESTYVDTQTYPTAANYTAAGTPPTGTAGTIVPAARTSQGNAVTYRSVAVNGVANAGFCLRGQNPSSSATNASYFWYSSQNGGLIPGASSANAPAGC